MNDTPTLLLVAVTGVLVAVGVMLLLERSLTRVLLGVILMGNGINLMILSTGGTAGGPPLLGLTPESEMADPLPQAMILTAIVITLGVTAFLLAMAYRSWQLQGNDDVQDDAEDRRIAFGGGRRELRRQIRRQRRELRAEIRTQRADLRDRMAAQDRREAAERAALRSRMLAADRELRASLRAGGRGGAGADDAEVAQRIRDARQARQDSVADLRREVESCREGLREHRRIDRETEREMRRELRRRVRAQKRRLHTAIRAERERLARAEDSDLQGSD
ncbi:Na(+)/H(+) antiporter subunit C [Marinitenerispora sediminis]|uniref:Na(+)/H(+) antiporter subunit C n=1 Tax=Marinitenerispora sediminis TaxID=1931232 RepID=A0A368T988_9ACTN|nr:Na(+)/H(+) antiporter subunit C [Marinitenerispora sediminis]RCV54770.1 Na(+)/H(+) antiporter subunit C [Marinitenerispora sediminis]RCV60554.1 Na(+)/H(+) antiporter subunit C [Marinitenerispora sediminis]RCV61020.1 Na(+)/H(+) antiporter subunit C [Marinitenerispora sediminis]